jgi:hypothetical protein
MSNNETQAIPSATLIGFDSALIGKTARGNNVYDLDLCVEKILIDSGNDDLCPGATGIIESKEEEYLYYEALEQFYNDITDYTVTMGKEIPFIILDGPLVIHPTLPDHDLPF